MDKAKIITRFFQCRHCSQIVAEHWAERLGIDAEMFIRMTGPLGGGCFHGDICGAVSSSLLVLGLLYGHYELGSTAENQRMIQITGRFKEQFTQRTGSLICRELTGIDFSNPEALSGTEYADVLLEKCSTYVQTALEVLEEVVETEWV